MRFTRRNVAAHVERVLPELDIDRETGWAHIAPMFHLADAWAVWAVTAAGGTHSFLSDFTVSGALSLLASGRVTMTNLVPTMYARLLREPGLSPDRFPRLRTLLSGGHLAGLPGVEYKMPRTKSSSVRGKPRR